MALRKKERPFRELGDLLESWRSEKYRSALGLFKEAASKFSFSYSAYADFERGVTLPSISHLLELAIFFEKNENQAAISWARVQMPTQKLKDLFKIGEQGPFEVEKTSPLFFENTWVYNDRDRDVFLKEPWLFETLTYLCTIYPRALPYKELKTPQGKPLPSVMKKYLSQWIKEGHLLETENGIRLKHPNIHLPETPDWRTIKDLTLVRVAERILGNITDSMLREGDSLRELITKPLSMEQARIWVKKLNALKLEFLSNESAELPSQGLSHPSHSLVLILGPRLIKNTPFSQ